MNEMSLEEQIRCMQEMRDYLGEFCKIMQNTMESFQNDIKYLRSYGLPVETERNYQQNYFAPANDKVEQVVSDIYQKHIDYIDRVVERLKRAAGEQ